MIEVVFERVNLPYGISSFVIAMESCGPRDVAMDQLAESLNSELGSNVRVLSTKYLDQDFTLVDVVNPAASKGAGVAAAAAELSIDVEQIMAIGDNYNDLEMLLFAGTGVVMANAPLSLREIPGFHPTASNTEDGVALAIEQFIL